LLAHPDDLSIARSKLLYGRCIGGAVTISPVVRAAARARHGVLRSSAESVGSHPGGPLAARVLALQRTAGNAATVRLLRRSWLSELIWGPDPDPDPADRLKGEEREEARERNQERFWQDPAEAAKALHELAGDVYRLKLSFWGNAIPSDRGLLEEIEDAFTAPGLSERSGPARHYALYVRERRSAAHAILVMHLHRHLSDNALRNVKVAADVEVPEVPEALPDLDEDVVAYPRTDLDFRRRAKELQARVEAMKRLIVDRASGGQPWQRLNVRARDLWDFLSLEFSHGPLPDKSKGGGGYELYLRERTAVAKYALDYSFEIPRQMRAEVERQAATAVQPYFEYGDPPVEDWRWGAIERAAWHSGDSGLRNEAFELDRAMVGLGRKIENARRALRERRETRNVSVAQTNVVQGEARAEFGRPPRTISKPHPVLRRFLQKYLIVRHEYARIVAMAGLVPADVEPALTAAATAKLAPVRALDDPDAIDKAEHDQGMPQDYTQYIDLPLDSPAWHELFDVDMRVGDLTIKLGWARSIADRGRSEAADFEIKGVEETARTEFGGPAPAPTHKHPSITAKLAEWRSLRHRFAIVIVRAKLVPADLKDAIETEAGLRATRPSAGKAARMPAGGRLLARDDDTRPGLHGERPPRHQHVLDAHLHLDPAVLGDHLLHELSTDRLLQLLEDVEPPAPPKLSMRDPRPLGGERPPPYPADPPGFERPARTAGVGALAKAVRSVPEVRRALDNLKYDVWDRLDAGDKTALLTTSITFGAGALGGFLATPGGREILGRLSGVELPVPTVSWLSFEFSSRNDVVGLGVHVDLGELLPARFGFGAAGPRDSSPSLYPDPGQRPR
jgi:hypothetical protein